ncbi:MAG: hypothetical protein HRT90_00670 [Candidatus Margulisbacteria bacterium]|nr:hypothetical protein [Candidatus Margulisiibacteriota bacterium]
MTLKRWALVAVLIIFAVPSLYGVWGKLNITEDVFYILYIKKEKVWDKPLVSKPGFTIDYLGDYYLLGKIAFDEKLNIKASFLSHEGKINEEINNVKEAIIERNKQDKSEYLSINDGRESFIKDIFSVWNLERFADSELGETYFKSGRKVFPQEEIEDDLRPGGWVYM